MLCILAKIDDSGREELLKMQKIAEQFGLKPKSLHGHVTLACYIGSDEKAFISSCRDKTKGVKCFKVFYDRIEVF